MTSPTRRACAWSDDSQYDEDNRHTGSRHFRLRTKTRSVLGSRRCQESRRPGSRCCGAST